MAALRRHVWARLVAAALFATPAAAAPEQEIVVTGLPDRAEGAGEFVRTVTVETGDQIARFDAPVCPAAFGLPDAQNRFLAARLRAVAAAAGMRTAREGCRANVAVIVADGADGFIETLKRERPALFLAMEASDIRRILRGSSPVRAWQVIEPRGSDGRPMEAISFIEHGGRLMYIGRAWHLKEALASRTARPTRYDLTLSFVVFDLAAADGLTLTQIADHAAMRAFARTAPGAAGRAGTILSLFGPATHASPPAELTAWDLAYLRALYRTSNVVSASQQRSAIARSMIETLDASTDPAR